MTNEYGMTLFDFASIANGALAAGMEIRVRANYELGLSQLFAGSCELCTVQGYIIHPGFLNSTKAGTPCRVKSFKDNGGFGVAHLANVKAVTVEMTNEYNSHDCDPEDEQEYYGSDRWLEDGREASQIMEW